LSPQADPVESCPAGAWQAVGMLRPITSSQETDASACAHASRPEGVHPEPLAPIADEKMRLFLLSHVARSAYWRRMKNELHELSFVQIALPTSVVAWSALTDEPTLPEHAARALAERKSKKERMIVF
jgi:hypothetical protein